MKWTRLFTGLNQICYFPPIYFNFVQLSLSLYIYIREKKKNRIYASIKSFRSKYNKRTDFIKQNLQNADVTTNNHKTLITSTKYAFAIAIDQERCKLENTQVSFSWVKKSRIFVIQKLQAQSITSEMINLGITGCRGLKNISETKKWNAPVPRTAGIVRRSGMFTLLILWISSERH